jgi:hypothetical protein
MEMNLELYNAYEFELLAVRIAMKHARWLVRRSQYLDRGVCERHPLRSR